jgi:hypothetical protein
MKKISRKSGKESMLKVLGYCFQTFPWSFWRMLCVQYIEKGLQGRIVKKSEAKKESVRSREFLYLELEFMSGDRSERDA